MQEVTDESVLRGRDGVHRLDNLYGRRGIYYMHVHGHETPADPARKLKPALDLIGTSGAGSATTGTVR